MKPGTYYSTHREDRLRYQKAYDDAHKVTIKARKAAMFQANKVKGSEGNES